MRQLKPALQYSEGRSKPWSGAKVINCFAEKADGDKTTDFAIMAIPGLDRFETVGDGPIRGAHQMGDLLYIVSGSELYSVTQAGVATLIGAIVGTGPVAMEDNGSHLAISAAPIGYVYSGGILQAPRDR